MLEIRLGFTVKYSQFDKKTVIEGFINRSHQPIEFKQKTWFCGIRVWLSKFIIKLTSFLPFRISSGNIYVRFSGDFDIQNPFEYNAETKGNLRSPIFWKSSMLVTDAGDTNINLVVICLDNFHFQDFRQQHLLFWYPGDPWLTSLGSISTNQWLNSFQPNFKISYSICFTILGTCFSNYEKVGSIIRPKAWKMYI